MGTATRQPLETVTVLGCPIARITIDGTIEKVDDFVRSRTPHQIVVVNAAKIVMMERDCELREIIIKADLVAADGVSVVWASRLLGTPLPGRVNGTDLMDRMIALAPRKGHRIFFFGATQEVIEEVVHKLRTAHPSLQIAGWRNGYFRPDDEEDIVRQIRDAEPDILFVGFGTPRKEKWVSRNLAAMNVPVCHGVGGSFDVLAGKVRRAPIWMQKAGLEWFFRFLQEPRRMWKRYLYSNTVFVYKVLKEGVARRCRAR